MTPEDLAALVARAQQGDQVAFDDVVTHTIDDVRLFIASYVPTTVLGDAMLHETYTAIQREFARCPQHEVSAWMCRVAATQLTARLGDAMRASTMVKDPLIELIVHRGSEELAKNTTGSNAAAVELPRRLQQQPCCSPDSYVCLVRKCTETSARNAHVHCKYIAIIKSRKHCLLAAC